MAKPLDERISAAMGHGARAATVADLIAEVKQAIATSRSDHYERDARSKSATVAEDEAEAAADEVAKLARRLVRLQAKLGQLESRYAELMNSERRRRNLEQYEAIKTRRDELVADLRRRWPALVAEMTALFTRIEASEAEIEAFRNNVPSGCEWLEGPESMARGVPANFYSGAGGPIGRLTKIKIPTFDGRGLAWPDPRPLQERRAQLAEQERRQLLARQTDQQEREARHKRYAVTPPEENRRGQVRLETYHGAIYCTRRGELRMSIEQAEAARAKGCKVELLAPAESIGLPIDGSH